MHPRDRILQIGSFIAAMIVSLGAVSCDSKNGESAEGALGKQSIIVVPVKRQTIRLRVSASGTIEPVREIEIKSKASGKILRLPVQSGDVVTENALLALVDTTESAADLRQKRAQLDYIRAQYRVAEQNRDRKADLFARGIISEDENDEAELEYTRMRWQLINSEADVEKAIERRNDTVLRAPISGTILEKNVEEGQIIASATSAFSEGTTLMKMADLTYVRVRVLVDESDVGRVRAGQHAKIVADAYPNRTFNGTIEKLEPVPKAEQNVTYYPVLITIDNSEGLLLPGMKTNAEIDVYTRENVVTVASDAIVQLVDAGYTGTLIDVPEDTVKSVIEQSGANPSMRDRAVVFRKSPASTTLTPVVVTIGVRDWNLTEIVDGLAEGDTALVPPSASIARQFQEFRERWSQWNKLPGQG